MSIISEAREKIFGTKSVTFKRVDNFQDQESQSPDVLDTQVILEEHNKFLKESGIRKTHPEVLGLLREFRDLRIDLADGGNAWSRSVAAQGRHLAKIIFRGEPFIGAYLEPHRRLLDVVGAVQEANLSYHLFQPEPLINMEKGSLYAFKAGGDIFREGISLLDIERLPKEDEESLGNIQAVNRLFTKPLLPRIGRPNPNYERAIQHSALFLATMEFAQPTRKVPIPDDLRPLQQQLTNYFDHHTRVLMEEDPVRTWRQFQSLTDIVRSPALLYALGCYVPARLGLTPTSAAEVYKKRVLSSQIPSLMWGRILKALMYESSEAWRPQSLPSELHPFIEYSEEAQKKAESSLKSAVDQGRLTPPPEVSYIEAISPHFYQIQTEISRSPLRRLTVTPENDGVFDEIWVTSHNRRNLLMIAFLADSDSYLNLEIGQNPFTEQYQMYGIPARLDLDNPGLDEALAQQVIPILLDKVMRRRQPRAVRGFGGLARWRESKKVTDDVIAQVDMGEDERIRTVLYSEKEIRDLYKRSPESVIQSILKGIQGFERGEKQIKPYTDIPGLGRVRIGDQRLVLEDLGNSVYDLVYVGNKKDIDGPKKMAAKKFF